MEEIIKIQSTRLTRLNLAEYANFVKRVLEQIRVTRYENLGIPKELFDKITQLSLVLGDIVSQSLVSDETAKIAEAEALCDELLRYFFALVSNGRHHPDASQRAAFTGIYNATGIYRGITRLPQGQQIQQTRGLVDDLGKATTSLWVIQLKLDILVQQIDEANRALAALIDSRSASQLGRELPSGRSVRLQIEELLDQAMSLAFATSVSAPTAHTAKFVASVNKIIDESRTAYNLRMGLVHHYRDQGQ